MFQLTPTRPLRSEVEKEKRLSRPPSGQFPTKLLLTPTTNGNRDSIGTTDSTASEEDGIPPPLPAKLRSEADYCNLPDGNGEATPHLRHSTPPLTRLRSKVSI
ncbi:hypothetical protein AAG570_009613 [Ranatra chinensis]|uniref:Uncharacterized protein n=1 Tax=Ranatra chinensis TaxID=642074 RepID=A0ABD0ZAQ2_9HEMI